MGGFGAESDPPAYPSYIEDAHKLWMDGEGAGAGEPGETKNLQEYMYAALDTDGQGDILSPFLDAHSYDPASDLGDASTTGAVQTRFDSYNTMLGTIDPVAASGDGSWNGIVDKAKTKAGQVVNSATEIDALVAAHEQDANDQLDKSLNDYAGPAYEARATQNSQFAVGVALLFDGRDRNVAAFRANLELQAKREETQFVIQSVGEIIRFLYVKADAERLATMLLHDIRRMKVLANKEYLNEELQIAVQEVFYPFDILKNGQSMLGAVSGIAQMPPRAPKVASAVSGMLGAVSAAGPLMMTGNPYAIAFGVGAGLLGALAGYGQGY